MKTLIKMLSLVLSISLLALPVYATAAPDGAAAAEGMAATAGMDAGKLLENQEIFPAGSSACDWAAMAFAMSGVDENYGAYLKALETYVTEQYAKRGCLDTIKATEYHRIALTVLALGGDPTAFGEKADAAPVDLIAEGTYNFAGELGKQGLNGWIFALISLDTMNYPVPTDAKYSREQMIEAILSAQEPDGGFGLVAGGSEIDITAMAIQALAPYQEEYAEVIEKALAYLAGQLNENCGYTGYGSENVESPSQVVIALCALGIDPVADERFCIGEENLLTNIARFRLEDGTYFHSTEETSSNLIATEQALLALIAVERLRAGESRIYDFTQYEPPKTDGNYVWILIPMLVIAAGIVVLRKRKKHE